MALAPDPATIKILTKAASNIADPVRKAHALQLTAKIAKRAVAPQKPLEAQQKKRQQQAKATRQEANRDTARERQLEQAKGRDFELGE